MRMFEHSMPRAAYVVQVVSSTGRESFAASTPWQALSKTGELLAAGKRVQIFAAGRGVTSIDELQQIVERDGAAQART